MNNIARINPATKLKPDWAKSADESIGKRTINQKTYIRKDNKTELVISPIPVHYKDNILDGNERWKEIILDPQKTGGNYLNDRSFYKIEILTDRVAYNYTSKGKGSVKVELVAIDGNPVNINDFIIRKKDNKVIYYNASLGIDFEVILKPLAVSLFKRLRDDTSPRNLKWKITEYNNGTCKFIRETSGYDDKSRLIELTNSIENLKTINIKGEEYSSFEFNEVWTGRTAIVRNKTTRQLSWSNEANYPILIDADVSEDLSAYGDFWYGGIQKPWTATAATSSWYGPGSRLWFGWSVWTNAPDKILISNLGIRFQTLNLPPGKTIESANLRLTINSGSGSFAHKYRIYGNDVDNAAAWSSGNFPNHLTETRTTAKATMSPTLTTFPEVENIDVSSIVQEIYARPGWATNNNMAFFASPFAVNPPVSAGSFWMQVYGYWDGDTSVMPILSILYTGTGLNETITADSYVVDPEQGNIFNTTSITMDAIIRDPANEKRNILVAGSANAISGGFGATLMGGQEGNPGWTNAVGGIGIITPVAGIVKRIKIWFTTNPTGGRNRFGLTVYDENLNFVTTIWSGYTPSGPYEFTTNYAIGAGYLCILERGYTGTANNSVIKWATEFITTKEKRFILSDGSFTLWGNDNSRRYAPIMAGSWFEATESEQSIEMPVACKLQEFCYMVNPEPGVGKTYNLSVYINGVENASTILTLTGTTRHALVTGLNISLAAGDKVSVSFISGSTPANNPSGSWGAAFEPIDADTDNVFAVASKNHINNTSTVYAPIHAGGIPWTTTEATWLRYWGFMKATLRKLRVKLSGAPGVGKSLTITARKNQVSSALTTTISDAATTGQDSANSVSIQDGDILTFGVTPSGTPSTSNVQASLAITVSNIMDKLLEVDAFLAERTTKTFTADGIIVNQVSRIEDDFNDNSIDAGKWANWGGGNVTEVNHRINIATATTSGYFGIETQEYLSLYENDCQIEIIDIGNTALASYEAYPIYLELDANNQLQWYVSGSSLRARKVVGGVGAFVGGALTFNATTHRFLRIRGGSDSNIHWEYSSTGLVWTELTSLAIPFDIGYLKAGMQSGTYSNEGVSTSLILDNFNIEPGTFTIDGYIALRTDFNFTADAFMALRTDKTFTADGYIAARTPGTFTADGLVAESGLLFPFTADAIIRTGYFFLGGTVIERPTGFSREQIFGRKDVLAVNGRTGRDISGNKERFSLSWDYLSKGEFDILKAIVDQNEPVDFFVNDGNLQIATTSVIPYLDTVSYETLGSDYYVATRITLVEET